MYEKLVPDAKCDQTDLNHYLLSSAETVTIQVGDWLLHAVEPMLYDPEY